MFFVTVLVTISLLHIGSSFNLHNFQTEERKFSCLQNETKCHFGCCPFKDATCCWDGYECCPKGQKCVPYLGICIGVELPERKILFSAKKQILFNHKEIPNNNSVQEWPAHKEIDGINPFNMSDCGIGSCPFADAVCCQDGLHCCPQGHTCDVLSNRCVQNSATETIVECPLHTTRCEHKCCPLPDAICCSDGIHCCPERHTCDVTFSNCVMANVSNE